MSTRLEDYEEAPEVEGVIVYDLDWYLLQMPADFHTALLPLLEAEGVPFKPVDRPHIPVLKDESPCRSKADWGVVFIGEVVKIKYHPKLHGENGLHFWVDCYSTRLCEMRDHFGLPVLRRPDGVYLVNFHMTVGRRKKAIDPWHRSRLQLTPHTHIDAETGMQHL